MGILGAAISALIARVAECLALVFITYWKKYPVAARINELLGFNLRFFTKIFTPVFPVILNELMWSLAITTYSVVYARIGTPSIAAMNIVGTVDNLAFVPFMGLSGAIAIICGDIMILDGAEAGAGEGGGDERLEFASTGAFGGMKSPGTAGRTYRVVSGG